MNGGYYDQYQAQLQAQMAMQGIAQGSYTRNIGNAQTAQMGNQALYQNYANAYQNYANSANMYGGAGMYGGAPYQYWRNRSRVLD